MSQADARPAPPPYALPLTNATTGFSMRRMVWNTCPRAFASSICSWRGASSISSSAERSAPAQKSGPSPSIATTLTGDSLSANSASASSSAVARSSAFFFSGRARVILPIGPSAVIRIFFTANTLLPGEAFSMSRRQLEAARHGVGNIDHHAQQCGRVNFPLSIGLERQRTTAVERAVEQEIERVEIRKLVTLDAIIDHAAKMIGDPISRDKLLQD